MGPGGSPKGKGTPSSVWNPAPSLLGRGCHFTQSGFDRTLLKLTGSLLPGRQAEALGELVQDLGEGVCPRCTVTLWRREGLSVLLAPADRVDVGAAGITPETQAYTSLSQVELEARACGLQQHGARMHPNCAS